jgi:hypothetical protein
MRNLVISFIIILVCNFTYGQNLDLDIIPDKTPDLYQRITFTMYLTNHTGSPVTIIDPRFCEPSWNLYKATFEVFVNDVKQDTKEFRDGAEGRFSLKNFITLAPQQKINIATKYFTLSSCGKYKVIYTHIQSPNLVNPKYAKDQIAIDKSKTIYSFIASKTMEFELKQVEYKDVAKIISMTWDELQEKRKNLYTWKKFSKSNLKEAFANPDSTIELAVNCTNLDFNSINNISRLKNLKILTLYDYRYPKLIDNLNQLGLYHLNLAIGIANFVLPNDIFSISTLRGLSITGVDSIDNISNIGRLENLESLKLSTYSLTKLPDSFGKLKKLKSLDLSGNKLTTLPNSFADLNELEGLNLTSNRLTSLNNIKSANLKSLQANNNLLTEITDEIKNIPNVEILFLDFNKIKKISSQIGSLSRLTKLYLSKNEFTELPVEIKNCIKLNDASFSYTPLIYLPEGISQIQTLLRLDLTNCKNLKKNNDFKELQKRLKKYLYY